ncbi:MAG TPA: hypothetical protein D7H85_01655 [Candidatus Poseidoniales archaeon]|nr:MAG TPA: hypothetical protein D7H85_01655 [Candidatus Poseidoniales archaeon]|tara:strand:- start:20439 stop:21908 length:1470 start_codon:yes stop_codon:yes gene_type:complete
MLTIQRRPKTGRDARALLGAEGVNIGLGVISQIILTRTLLDIEYGWWVIVYDLFATLLLVLDFGIPTLVARDGPAKPTRIRAMVHYGLRIQCRIAALTLPPILLIAWIGFDDMRTSVAILSLAIGAALMYLSGTHRVALRAVGEAREEAIARVIDKGLMVGGYAVVWAIGRDGLMEFAMVYAGASMISTIYVIWRSERKLTASPQEDIQPEENAKTLLIRAAPFALTLVILPLMARMDKFLLAGFQGLELVAVYNIAWIVLMAGWAVPRSIQQALLPVFSNASANEGALRTEQIRAMHLVGLLTPFGIFVALPIATIGLPALFPNSLVEARPGEGIDAVSLFVLMLPAWVWGLLSSPMLESTKLSNRTTTYARVILVGLAVNLTAGLLLVPTFSLKGAAISTTIGHLCIHLQTIRTSGMWNNLQCRSIMTMQLIAGILLHIAATTLALTKSIESTWIKLGIPLCCFVLATLLILKPTRADWSTVRQVQD